MRIGFSVVYLLVCMYAIAVNWRLLKAGLDKFLFILLAGLSFGLLLVYMLKISFAASPVNWMIQEVVPYIIRSLKG